MIQRAVAILEKEIGGASMMQIKTAEITPLLRITQDRLKTFQESSLRGSRLAEGHRHPQEEGNSISVEEKESKEVVDMIQRAVAIPEKEMSGGASTMRQDASTKSGAKHCCACSLCVVCN